MNREKYMEIVWKGMGLEGRRCSEVLRLKHHPMINTVTEGIAKELALRFINKFPVLEAQLDEQGFPKPKVAGASPV